jgi:hypothetical protein
MLLYEDLFLAWNFFSLYITTACEIKSSIAMVKAVFNKKKALFTSKID